MYNGQLASVVVDSLSAFFPGVQTLIGDVDSAIKAHAVYAFQWKVSFAFACSRAGRANGWLELEWPSSGHAANPPSHPQRYGGLPELFDINRRQAVSLGAHLALCPSQDCLTRLRRVSASSRVHRVESLPLPGGSNSLLFWDSANLQSSQATKDEWYLEIAEQVLSDINNRTRVACGLAAVLDLTTGVLEDKQPSFLTSETLKYLFLTFDEVGSPPLRSRRWKLNPDSQGSSFNLDDSATVYSTEGHMLSVDTRPVLGRRRRSLPAEAPICPAYNPHLLEQSQHFLSLGVSRRTDIEHARFLAGYVVDDERKEIAEGRWSESGWCEVPVSEVRRLLPRAHTSSEP